MAGDRRPIRCMVIQAQEEFDFDRWSQLAREDPQAFEALRAEALRACIETATPRMRRRLWGLQWQLDQIRRRSGTPLAACMEISRRMWDTVLGEDGLLASMRALSSRPADPRERPSATVLPFKAATRR